MTDLVKMLRETPIDWQEAHETLHKAADRIEALEAEKERLRATFANIEAGLNMLHVAIAEKDPTRELMLRVNDLAEECARAALTPKD